MRTILVLLVGLCAAASAVAQTTVSGTVKERNDNSTIPYATVSLMTPDSTLVTGAITDDNGHYSLAAAEGNYILQVSYVGYNTICRNVQVGSKKLTVDDVFLTEETEQLEQVEVAAKRPLVERQVDKLVLNVSQSAFAVGNSGQDILKKAPGVNIDKDGNITVNGKSVEIYIDGRPSYMSGEQLKGMLQGTDGATIEKIEIITNPSSKYEAAGQGGIINIKLKKNKSQGLNGMLNAAYGGMYYKNPGKYTQADFVSLNLNYRAKKTYTAFSLTQVYADQGQQIGLESGIPVVVGSDTLTQHTKSQSLHNLGFQYYNARLSNDWYIDSVNTLGFILNVPIMMVNVGSTSDRNYSLITLEDDTLQHVVSTVKQKMIAPQYTANLNFTHTFNDSLSRELTVNADYNRYENRNDNSQRNNILVNTTGLIMPERLDIATRQKVDIYSAKIDFQTAFWKTGMIECGAKWRMSNTFNTMTTDSVLPQNDIVYNSQTTTRFDYSEQVAALYISASKQFNQHWNAKLGLRGELTYAKGLYHLNDQSQTVEQKPYFNLFPTAFVGYNPTDKWSLSLSYTRRIKRPSYWTLNPFISYVDAHSYQMGNPELKPEFSHKVDLNVGWSQYVSVGFNFAHTQQMFTQKIELLPNGDRRMVWSNFGTNTTHGISVSLTELPLVPKRNDEGKINGAWLALTVNGDFGHFINRAEDNSYVRRTFWGNVYGCLTAYLPEDIQMSFDASYDSPMVDAYSYWESGYVLNFGFKKQFLHKTLTLSLNVSDILRSTSFDEETLGLEKGAYNKMSFNMLGSQRVSIGITYMFGQFQQHKFRKVGDSDDASRLGTGGGFGSK